MSGPRVVVVEDDAIQAALITMQVADLAKVVARFTTCTGTTQWSGWGDVDAALIDWQLPDGNGGQVIDWLGDHYPHVRCVILTAATPPPEHPRAVGAAGKTHMSDAMRLLTEDPT